MRDSLRLVAQLLKEASVGIKENWYITIESKQFRVQNRAKVKHLDLGCVLRPHTEGAGCKIRVESTIKNVNPILCMIGRSQVSDTAAVRHHLLPLHHQNCDLPRRGALLDARVYPRTHRGARWRPLQLRLHHRQLRHDG